MAVSAAIIVPLQPGRSAACSSGTNSSQRTVMTVEFVSFLLCERKCQSFTKVFYAMKSAAWPHCPLTTATAWRPRRRSRS